MKGENPAADLSDDLLNRYSRHILLPEIGIEGQQKIGGARFFVVGAGGLGSPAALYLAAAGAGAIVVCDHDRVDLTNLQRQILHDDSQIGARKVDSAARALRRANPHIEIVRVARAIDDDNADELLRGVDVVIDGSDNFAARHAVNRAAARARAPLVSGAATGFDGQLAVFRFARAGFALLSLLVRRSRCRAANAVRRDGRFRAAGGRCRRDAGGERVAACYRHRAARAALVAA